MYVDVYHVIAKLVAYLGVLSSIPGIIAGSRAKLPENFRVSSVGSTLSPA